MKPKVMPPRTARQATLDTQRRRYRTVQVRAEGYEDVAYAICVSRSYNESEAREQQANREIARIAKERAATRRADYWARQETTWAEARHVRASALHALTADNATPLSEEAALLVVDAEEQAAINRDRAEIMATITRLLGAAMLVDHWVRWPDTLPPAPVGWDFEAWANIPYELAAWIGTPANNRVVEGVDPNSVTPSSAT